MIYPQAPWNLKGYGFQTVNVIDVDRVRPIVPSNLQIVSVMPGKTVGGLYIAYYGEGSTLTYSELIVVGALVRHGWHLGAWVSHIYVDNPVSEAGGHDIWGLPKQLAQFKWRMEEANPRVEVYQDDILLCSLARGWKLPGWKQSLNLPFFSTLHTELLNFEGKSTFKFGIANLDLSIPAQSPFAELQIGRPWLGFCLDSLQLIAGAPSAVSNIS